MFLTSRKLDACISTRESGGARRGNDRRRGVNTFASTKLYTTSMGRVIPNVSSARSLRNRLTAVMRSLDWMLN